MKSFVAAALVVSLMIPVAAHAEEPTAAMASGDKGDKPEETTPPSPAFGQTPTLAFTLGADGASKGTFGASAFAQARSAVEDSGRFGGGARIWGSPINRLTLFGEAQRNTLGEFAPAGGAMVRLLGDRERGWSLAGLGLFRFKGGANEVESELESGVLVGFNQARLHLDVNGIFGVGFGDDGDKDLEGRARLGVDVLRELRFGFDSQLRARLDGKALAGGRSWDFFAGPQVVAGTRSFFASLTVGPTTSNLARSVGVTSIAMVGGTTN
jgi:hypothetical protein